jgi:hypothetical protein
MVVEVSIETKIEEGKSVDNPKGLGIIGQKGGRVGGLG